MQNTSVVFLLRYVAIAFALFAASASAAGTGAVLSVSPSSVNFSAVQNVGTTSSPVALLVTNTGSSAANFTGVTLAGGNPADFAVSGNTCTGSLAAGASCSASVTFAPMAGGIRMSSLVLTDDAAGSPQSVAITGAAQGANQQLAISPTTMVFAQTTVGNSTSAFILISSFSEGNIAFTGTVVTGTNPADFAVVENTCLPLYPSSSCEIIVQFTPQAAGLRTATLQLQDTAAGSPQNVPLVGTGIALTQNVVFTPVDLDVSSQTVGVSATYPITVTNYGTGAVTFSSYVISGTNATDFVLTTNSCPTGAATLAPSQTCQMNVTFTPAAAGGRSAWLTVTSSAPGSPQHLSLLGAGEPVTNLLAFSSGALDFGAQNVGTASGTSVVSLQSSTSSVTLSNIYIAGTNASDFAINSSTCYPGLLLGPYYQCNVHISFLPAASGYRTANLTFTDNAAGSPQVVTLEGIGQTPVQQLGLSVLNEDFGIATVGFPVYASNPGILLTNSGDSSITVSSISISGPNAADFGMAGDCLGAIAPGATCNAAVVFTPSSAGLRSAQINIADSAPGSPQTIGLFGTGQAVDLALTSTSAALLFPVQTIGSVSSAAMTTIGNAGNSPVMLSSVTITGKNSSEFTATNECPTVPSTFSEGANCPVYVTFSPTGAGLQTSTLQFTDSGGTILESLALVGVGYAAGPPLTLSPSAAYLGSQAVGVSGSATSITISNPGTGSIPFTVGLAGVNASDYLVSSNNCGASLPPSASCKVSVTFTPAAVGARIAALQVIANGTTLLDCGLVGTGVAGTASIATNPLAVDLGVANVGQTSYQGSLQISNTGAETVTIAGISIGGSDPGDFNIGDNSCESTLAAGASCTLALRFTPMSAGLRNATLMIADNATGSPQGIPLSGLGQAVTQLLEVPLSITFPLTSIGSLVTQSATVTNIGTYPVTMTSATIAGTNASDFSIGSPTCSSAGSSPIFPGGNCQYPVSFTPAAPGFRTATLQLIDSAAGSPQSIPLNGFGLAVTQTLLFPPAVSFSLTPVGLVAAPQTISFNNTGNTAVNVTSVAITGTDAADFSISQNSCGTQISPGTACTVTVSFDPVAPGVRKATLQLSDSATGSPQSVTLTGVGEAGIYSVNLPSAVDLGLSTVGFTLNSSTPISLYNTGDVAVTFSSFSFGGGNPGDFSVYSTSCKPNGLIQPGGSCIVYLGFTPAAIGTRSGTLLVADNAAGSPQSVALMGVGQAITDTADITPALLFGSVAVNSAATLSASLDNTGTSTITVGAVSISGPNAADFTVGSNSCSSGYQLSPARTCTIKVTFTPSGRGTRTATLQVTDNALGATQTCILQGIGQ